MGPPALNIDYIFTAPKLFLLVNKIIGHSVLCLQWKVVVGDTVAVDFILSTFMRVVYLFAWLYT